MTAKPAEAISFVVAAADARQRIDMLVVELMARAGHDVSRSAVRQWIDQGGVTIDGRVVKAGGRATPGSSLTVVPQAAPVSDASPDPTIGLNVIHEDEHLIAIDKPAGLVVHPSRGHAAGTLVNALLAHTPIDMDASDDADPDRALRPGIVHRLDKDTSGVMVVARTARAREGLKALFTTHDIEREYRAVVVGDARDATYDTPFGRHPTDRLRFSTKARGATRRAVTHVRVVERLAAGKATLVACTLETGRTHQIRVHLSECGRTPVLGDKLYGIRVRDASIAAIAATLERHWLHAAVLGFVHPITGQRMRFESAPPSELAEVLEALRRMPGASGTR